MEFLKDHPIRDDVLDRVGRRGKDRAGPKGAEAGMAKRGKGFGLAGTLHGGGVRVVQIGGSTNKTGARPEPGGPALRE
jgi:hypothetical protein